LVAGVGIVFGLGSLVLWIGANELMVLLGGADFINGSRVLRWLAFVPLVVAMSNLMGVQVMLPQGMTKPFTAILAIASLLSVLLLYPMVRLWGALGAAQLVFFVESVVTALMAIYLWRITRRNNKY
jgi:O-antigen/teichoic acid export membrane protein